MASVLLAAGAGTRVGTPKVGLRVGGRSLLSQQVAVARAAGVAEILVVLGAEAHRALEEAETLGVHAVVHEGWRAGQSSSVRAGLRELPCGVAGFLLHPIDHAFCRASDLAALLEAFGETEAPRPILRPHHPPEAFGHPVLFERSYAEEFLALPPERPAHAVYRAHRDRVLLVPRPDGALARDVDAPDDLAALRAWLEDLGAPPEAS